MAAHAGCPVWQAVAWVVARPCLVPAPPHHRSRTLAGILQQGRAGGSSAQAKRPRPLVVYSLGGAFPLVPVPHVKTLVPVLYMIYDDIYDIGRHYVSRPTM